MKLDVESLRTLREVVDVGGFTEAAARLGITQSAVSWKIKRLEERVGAELVHRGQRIEATPDGHDLLGYAEVIIEAHDAAVDRLSRSDLTGTVRLGSNEDLHAPQLAKIVARFNRVYPEVHLGVRIGLSGQVRQWLDRGEVDIALLQLPADEVWADDIELWREPVNWVGAPAWVPVEPLPVIGFGPGWAINSHVAEALDRSSRRWRTVIECPSLAGVQAAIRAGLGVAALNPSITPSDLQILSGTEDMALPEVSQLIRLSPSNKPADNPNSNPHSELLGLLADELKSELGAQALNERQRSIGAVAE